MSQKQIGLVVLLIFCGIGLLAASRLMGRSKGRPAMESELSSETQAHLAAEPPQPESKTTSAQLTNAVETEKVRAEEFVAWNQFRGPDGQGISDDPNIPTEWSEEKNLAWKAELPGPGASSPVLTKSFVFVTSYSGYGVPGERGGSQNGLERQLTCFDRKTGDRVWSKSVKNVAREDAYSGMGLPEHGYSTNTPVTNGKFVFVFYGKSGVLAYDLEGNEKWRTSVGDRSANRRWGSAASLLLYRDMVIVNASEEDRAVYALDQETGNVVWKAPGESLELCYSTPGLVKVDDNRTDLVIALAGELWGINPTNGKLAWYVATPMGGNLSPSLNIRGDKVYAFGGYRQTGSIGIRVGGKGELDDSSVLWESRNTSYVPTPVLVDGKFYWLDNKGMYFCANASDGELVCRERVNLKDRSGHPVYASAIAINNQIYCQTRRSGLFVLEPSDKLKVISNNHFSSDNSDFNATPAVDHGQLFLRSNRYLYCVQTDE